MKYMTERQYVYLMKKAHEDNIEKQRKRNLKNEKNKYKRKLKLPSTSKMILLVVILLCLEIIFFSEYAMLVTGDMGALYALIGVPATLVPTIWGYYSKSKVENSKNGIIYDIAMAEFNQNQTNNNLDETLDNNDSVG